MKIQKVNTEYALIDNPEGVGGATIEVNEEYPTLIRVKRYDEVWQTWDDMVTEHETIIQGIKELRKEYNK